MPPSMTRGLMMELAKEKKLLKGFKPFGGARPLPEVPGIMFRGLVGPYKSDMAMLQSFASPTPSLRPHTAIAKKLLN